MMQNRLQGPGLLNAFDPPAFLTDLRPANKNGWSQKISGYCNNSQIGNKGDPFDHPRPQFFNSTKVAVGSDVALKTISWTAFPRVVQQNYPNDNKRFEVADGSREVQDEYCEWSVTKDKSGKIIRVTFTCEGPEYWEYLAEKQPETVLELYQQHVNPTVTMDDLFVNGKYNLRNKWNNDTVNGAMHLVQRNNTLEAEIELAAGASIVRLDEDGELLTDTQDLIMCGKYGNKLRFSDPFIGSEVNALARKGALLTVENPIALYFDRFAPTNFTTPDGTDAATFWKWTRGTEGRYLRGVYEVPSDKPYVVGDITITGKGKVKYGGMLADYIKIKLVGLACSIDKKNVKPVKGCVGDSLAAAKAASFISEGRPAASRMASTRYF